MSDKQWTHNQLSMIGAQATRFPATQVAHWNDLRGVPEKIRSTMDRVNAAQSCCKAGKARIFTPVRKSRINEGGE
jgi:hypothetical protein